MTSMKLVRVGRHYNFCALQYDSLYTQKPPFPDEITTGVALLLMAHLASPGNEFKVHSKS